MRADFFGPGGDTTWNRQRLEADLPRYTHHDLDIRDRAAVDDLRAARRATSSSSTPPPSRATTSPPRGPSTTSTSTPSAPSTCSRRPAATPPTPCSSPCRTNKVYGDNPNQVPLVELETRWDYADPALRRGHRRDDVASTTALHSVFGASKVAADVLTQEYGRYFGLRTGTLPRRLPHRARTTPASSCTASSATSSHTALREGAYTIFGYKGKQVRDQIHSADVISAFWAFAQDPRPGEVYNLGGGKAERRQPPRVRRADRRGVGRQAARRSPTTTPTGSATTSATTPTWAKFRAHYPGWRQEHDLPAIVDEMVGAVAAAARLMRPPVRLTLVNQFYAPDISPTAQLAASLAEHRAEPGRPRHHRHRPGRLPRGPGARRRACAPGPGLRIRRVWTPDLGKSSRARRLLGYAPFSLGARAAAARSSRARTSSSR